MSENKFTPGPYEMDGPQIVGNGYGIGHVNSHRTTEGKANALLFSAAPDLLEALEAVLLVVGQLRIGEHLPCDQGMNVTKLCMAAIAKARGEA